VQVDYNVAHLRTSLVQLFVLLFQNFEKLVQITELKRFGGAPNGYPFAPLVDYCIRIASCGLEYLTEKSFDTQLNWPQIS
jgi:hypothetical protein